MALYVDDPRHPLGRMKMCHMTADSLEELHAAADRLGLKRDWYQGPPKTERPHYDISLSRRRRAVEELDAQEVSTREIVTIARRMRLREALKTPRGRY
jgi:hypothetical protein